MGLAIGARLGFAAEESRGDVHVFESVFFGRLDLEAAGPIVPAGDEDQLGIDLPRLEELILESLAVGSLFDNDLSVFPKRLRIHGLFVDILGDEGTRFKNSKVYSQVGVGVLIKNANLVFNTFQLSISFYPLIPGLGQNIFKTNSFKTTDFGFRDFEFGKPSMVVYQ